MSASSACVAEDGAFGTGAGASVPVNGAAPGTVVASACGPAWGGGGGVPAFGGACVGAATAGATVGWSGAAGSGGAAAAGAAAGGPAGFVDNKGTEDGAGAGAAGGGKAEECIDNGRPNKLL
mmetsp:Transcript_37445/g.68501  ORF Transcript_37445/g.68501 Transcript_37445/m.68501 type:complete len:122 (-) Transcript_37445:1291-1656(-)